MIDDLLNFLGTVDCYWTQLILSWFHRII